MIDLKIDEFKPEYAGKMNFYLSAVDDLLRHPADAPTIGLILFMIPPLHSPVPQRARNRAVDRIALRTPQVGSLIRDAFHDELAQFGRLPTFRS